MKTNLIKIFMFFLISGVAILSCKKQVTTPSNSTTTGGTTISTTSGSTTNGSTTTGSTTTGSATTGSATSGSTTSGSTTTGSTTSGSTTGSTGVSACDSINTKFPTVTIGSQTWMERNLNVCKYRNGDDIPQVQDQNAWKALTTGAWCYAEDFAGNGPIYGKLYNTYAIYDPRGLAPLGFHVPTNDEWITLTDFLGGESVAGGKMKLAGTQYWESPNTNASNSSNFTALPAGFRSAYGTYGGNLHRYAKWGSSTEIGNGANYGWQLYSGDGKSSQSAFNFNAGVSIRCLAN